MSESLFRKFMLVMYLVLLGISGWILYVDPGEWRQVAGLVAVGSPAFFWIVRFTCNVARRHGGFSPAAGAKDGAAKEIAASAVTPRLP